MEPYPHWLDSEESVFLREVGPGLFVGAKGALDRAGGFDGVIDLHGTTQEEPGVLVMPFADGLGFPPGVLSRCLELESRCRTLLIVCEVGRSRSASCAYALLRRLHGLSHEEAVARVSTSTEITLGPGNVRSVDWPRRKTLASARRWSEL